MAQDLRRDACQLSMFTGSLKRPPDALVGRAGPAALMPVVVAARRNSRANSSGEHRKAEKTSSGNSKVTLTTPASFEFVAAKTLTAEGKRFLPPALWPSWFPLRALNHQSFTLGAATRVGLSNLASLDSLPAPLLVGRMARRP
jgi:hypothetical protein